MREDDFDVDIDDDFLDNPPNLKPLPSLKSYKWELGDIPESLTENEKAPRMVRSVGVRFGEFGKVHDFFCDDDEDIMVDDPVVAECPGKGVMLGWVAKEPIRFDNSEIKLRLKRIQRMASDADVDQYEHLMAQQERALMKTKEHVARLNLDMQILNVEYTLDMRKAIVYFASENRVDFRNLLKELVHDLRAKVELRQIGVRDQAKMKGGIGPCGEELCCSRHIKRFHAVNIKMAKDQKLSLKPTRVSGMCGRLKCCLQYENDAYRSLIKGTPHVGQKVKCSKGCGRVSDVDVLRQFVVVQFEDGHVSRVDVKDLFRDGKKTEKYEHKNEKMVATTDQGELLQQIEKAKEDRGANDKSKEVPEKSQSADVDSENQEEKKS